RLSGTGIAFANILARKDGGGRRVKPILSLGGPHVFSPKYLAALAVHRRRPEHRRGGQGCPRRYRCKLANHSRGGRPFCGCFRHSRHGPLASTLAKRSSVGEDRLCPRIFASFSPPLCWP